MKSEAMHQIRWNQLLDIGSNLRILLLRQKMNLAGIFRAKPHEPDTGPNKNIWSLGPLQIRQKQERHIGRDHARLRYACVIDWHRQRMENSSGRPLRQIESVEGTVMVRHRHRWRDDLVTIAQGLAFDVVQRKRSSCPSDGPLRIDSGPQYRAAGSPRSSARMQPSNSFSCVAAKPRPQ